LSQSCAIIQLSETASEILEARQQLLLVLRIADTIKIVFHLTQTKSDSKSALKYVHSVRLQDHIPPAVKTVNIHNSVANPNKIVWHLAQKQSQNVQFHSL